MKLFAHCSLHMNNTFLNPEASCLGIFFPLSSVFILVSTGEERETARG
jgi:hypothetical protein